MNARHNKTNLNATPQLVFQRLVMFGACLVHDPARAPLTDVNFNVKSEARLLEASRLKFWYRILLDLQNLFLREVVLGLPHRVSTTLFT